MRWRLATRGGWLILLELTVIGFGFNFAEPFILLQVIWAIGLGMVLLALMLDVSKTALATIGALLIAFDLQLAGLMTPVLPPVALHMLLLQGPLDGLPGMVAYPALPWVGIFLLGYASGPSLLGRRADLVRRALLSALALLAMFTVLRLLGVGDPRGWGEGSNRALEILSFVNVSKYPPSPQYVLLMLGVSGILLALFDRLKPDILGMFEAFGRAPFFTYILHIYLVHGSAVLIGVALGFDASDFFGFIESTKALKDAGWGLPLGSMLVIWVAILLLLRPASIWFARLKAARSDWWLSYL